MDPDVMVTIAFVGYAVLIAIGLGVGLVIAERQRDPGMDDDEAQPAGARVLASRVPTAAPRLPRLRER
jgi:hypothetical protein